MGPTSLPPLALMLTGCGAARELSFLDDTTIRFATAEETAAFSSTSDSYTQSLGAWEIPIKTGDASHATEVDYLDHAAEQGLEWTNLQMWRMTRVIEDAEERILEAGLELSLPEEINLMRSTMEEEGGPGGAYARSGQIVSKWSLGASLFLHELFHVYTYANPDIRDDLYATVNFHPCDPIELPEAFQRREITAPDMKPYQHTMTVRVDGMSKDVIFVAYTEEPYDGGSFWSKLEEALLVVEGDGETMEPVLEDGEVVLLSHDQIDNLDDLLGTNTDYRTYPEEVLADQFAQLVRGEDVPEPELLDALEDVLR